MLYMYVQQHLRQWLLELNLLPQLLRKYKILYLFF